MCVMTHTGKEIPIRFGARFFLSLSFVRSRFCLLPKSQKFFERKKKGKSRGGEGGGGVLDGLVVVVVFLVPKSSSSSSREDLKRAHFLCSQRKMCTEEKTTHNV